MTVSDCGLDIAFHGNSVQEDGELYADVCSRREADFGQSGSMALFFDPMDIRGEHL